MNYIKQENIVNKGVGYVALDQITPNTLVLSEKIKLIVSKKNKSYNVMVLTFVYLLLSNKKLEPHFKSFSPHELDKFCTTELKIKEIINDIKNSKIKEFFHKTNLQDVILFYEKIKRNIFELGNDLFVAFDGSKFNHSCVPNVDYYFNKETSTLTFYSNKEINKGDELCISYIKPNVSPTCLKQTYGFDCKCTKCEK